MFTHAVLLRALARLHERQGGKNPNDIFPAETLGHQDLTRVETAIAAQVGSKRIATVDTGTLPRATRPLHFPGRPPRMHRGSALTREAELNHLWACYLSWRLCQAIPTTKWRNKTKNFGLVPSRSFVSADPLLKIRT